MRPALRRYVSNNGTMGSVSARSSGSRELCVYPERRAPAVGHWLPPTPWSSLLDRARLSAAGCTVGCAQHDGSDGAKIESQATRGTVDCSESGNALEQSGCET